MNTLAERELEQVIQILERFNAQVFFNIAGNSQEQSRGQWFVSSAGNGSGSGGTLGTSYLAQLTQQQVDFVWQSYQQLKESVYGTLALQTRLKPYLF